MGLDLDLYGATEQELAHKTTGTGRAPEEERTSYEIV